MEFNRTTTEQIRYKMIYILTKRHIKKISNSIKDFLHNTVCLYNIKKKKKIYKALNKFHQKKITFFKITFF